MTSDGDLLLDDSLHTGAKHLLYRYYLDAWLPILIRARFPRVRIVDGFAGPGRYKVTGRTGSPQIAIEAILENPSLRPLLNSGHRILLQFIEQNPGRAKHLESELEKLPKLSLFRWEVKTGDFDPIWSAELDRIEAAGANLEPTLLFIDGFGYAGFPLDLLARARGYQSCEVLINFAWESINRWALNDSSKHDALTRLYGSDRWRPGVAIDDPWEREQFFLAEYQNALADVGWRGTSFRMLNDKNQTSYHLVFGTTSPRGMEVFKSAAWRVAPDGLFQFADLRSGAQSGFLRNLTNEFVADDFKKKLLAQYTGQTVSREELETFTAWHPIALSRHRTSALKQLQDDGILELIPPARRPGEFPRGSAVRFLPKPGA